MFRIYFVLSAVLILQAPKHSCDVCLPNASFALAIAALIICLFKASRSKHFLLAWFMVLLDEGMLPL